MADRKYRQYVHENALRKNLPEEIGRNKKHTLSELEIKLADAKKKLADMEKMDPALRDADKLRRLGDIVAQLENTLARG